MPSSDSSPTAPAAGCCDACAGGVLAEHLRVIAASERARRASAASMSRATRRDRGPRTLRVTSMRRDAAFARDLVRRRRHAHVGDRRRAARSRRPAVSIGSRAGRRRSVRTLGRAPHHDVEDLLLLVDLADLGAAQQRRDRVADLRRRDAELLGRLGAHAHLDLRHQRQRLDLQVGHAGDLAERLAHLGRLSSRSSSRLGPKMRTTIVALAPVSTSLMRSRR